MSCSSSDLFALLQPLRCAIMGRLLEACVVPTGGSRLHSVSHPVRMINKAVLLMVCHQYESSCPVRGGRILISEDGSASSLPVRIAEQIDDFVDTLCMYSDIGRCMLSADT